jgi:hypothetical protein
MKLVSFLGKRLKEDDVLELLEFHDIQVIYDFDRTHENMPDKYWAPCREQGFQLAFNEDQVLNVVFCYIEPSEGFSPIDPETIGVSLFVTFDEAERHCRDNSLKYRVSGANSPGWWLRIEGETFWTHYQFSDGHIFRVTVTLPK